MVWLTALGVTRDAAAGVSCPAAARVEGDPEVVATVTQELSRRGVDPRPAGNCAAIRATVTRRGADVEVRVEDQHGRSATRVVALATVATVIESWARADLSAGLLPEPPASTGPGAAARPNPPPVELRGRAAPAKRPLGSVALWTETAVGTDGSVWVGPALTACVRLGPVCAGVLAHVASDVRVPTVAGAPRASRLDAGLLLAADLPLRLGRATLTPGLTVGVAWLRTSASNGNDNVDSDSGGLRLGAHVVLSYRLWRSLALDVGLAVDVAPLAHTGPQTSEVVALPGEPRAYVRAAVGLRYGVP
jgi:hypothetical protein